VSHADGGNHFVGSSLRDREILVERFDDGSPSRDRVGRIGRLPHPAADPADVTATLSRFVLAILLLASSLATGAAPSGKIAWQRDDTAAFAQAAREQRFVLLYLEAVWCHWCHVMQRETFTDAGVQAALAAHYVPLRIDHDARPDLANRYRDYGWPATIVFAPDGTEIVKRQGYIAPAPMRRLLEAIVADPSPERSAALRQPVPASPVSTLDAALRETLAERHARTHDAALGGLRTQQKFIDRDSVEYELALGLEGEAGMLAQARRTLDAATALIDPAWGGVYQYSTHGDWRHPHFEKLGFIQGDYLRLYALAYAATGEARYRAAAEALLRYLRAFLADPGGGYYTSQDADLVPGQHAAEFFALDDAGRRGRGMPRIDRHRYAREAGLIAEALLAWSDASGDAASRAEGEAAVAWLLRERLAAGSAAAGDAPLGFAHGERGGAVTYLGDNLAAGRALLALYRSSGERRWLDLAARNADYIDANFRADGGGFAGAARAATPIAPVPQLDENIALARHANLLAHYTGQARHRAVAEHAFAWLAQPGIALSRLTEAGILLADRELSRDPLHLTVVGPRADAAAGALYAACRAVASPYKRLEWLDPAQGPLPNPDVQYPRLSRAAAFVCTGNRCSVPIRAPGEVALFLAEERTRR
jgi:uncharacterized protein